MKQSIILILLLSLFTSSLLMSQSGYDLLEKRQRDAEYFYIEVKSFYDKQEYYKALERIEDAIDAAPLHYNISHYYYEKGEIYRKLYELYQRDSDIEESYRAFRESVRLDSQPKSVFHMNYSLFEMTKNEGIKINRVDADALGEILENMWQAILDYEEIEAWESTVSDDLDDEFHMFLEKCIDAGLLSKTPNSYLSKIINMCRRGKQMNNSVVAGQWNLIETKMRIDEYNLPCSGNLYLAHKKALSAIREKSDRLYDHALDYYRAAVDTAQTKSAQAQIYNEMAHFVNSSPFYQLYDAVKYAGIAHETLPLDQKYAEEYGDFVWLLVHHIIKVEIAGKETFSQKSEKPKIQKAAEYLEKATQFQWGNQVKALVLCSVYHEWLQTPWDDDQQELRQALSFIMRAFEMAENKNDNIILTQLIRVNKKLGAEGIRNLRELDEKYQMNISELALKETNIANLSRVDILITQMKELQAELYEITLDNYQKYVELSNKISDLSFQEQNSPGYEQLLVELQNTKNLLDDLFSKKVDLLYRIGYSKPQETEIQTLSQQVFADNVLNITRTTREKVRQISVPDRMLK